MNKHDNPCGEAIFLEKSNRRERARQANSLKSPSPLPHSHFGYGPQQRLDIARH